MHLRFACSASGPFTKNKERIQKFKETRIQACFQHNIAYENCIDLSRIKVADRILLE